VAGTSLTGIFAPGSPPLVESLRTLVLDPNRTVSPGETIRATFTFSNSGGAPATGTRVRFSYPPGVAHVAGSDLIDDRPLGDGQFVDATGADSGDLAANADRKLECTFRVNDTVEDGSELAFQAALVSDQTPLLGSNIGRVIVRSPAILQNSSTFVTLVAPEAPHPGDTVTVRATVVNTGSSSAHDVVVLLPAPEHTTVVPRSARIDGRIVPVADAEAFDSDGTTIVSERLAPGASVIVEYQATIDSPLPDATRIKASGTVGAREVGEFAVASAEVLVASPVDFSGEDTALTLLCDDVVVPGMRIPMILRAVNAGTGAAEFVAMSFALPPGLVYAPGSAHVDGQTVGDDAVPGLTFSVGTLAAGRVIEVGLAATVAVPAPDVDVALPVEAVLHWKGGERDFARRLSARVAPRFSRARNFIEANRGSVNAREEVRFLLHVYNDGTAAEHNAVLRVIPGAYLDDVRVAESTDEPVPYREPLDLGIVPPHHERVFIVSARVASKVPDRSNVTFGAVLDVSGGTIDVGTATVVVRSRAQVLAANAAWEVTSKEPLRPNRLTEVVVRFTNGGSDTLRDARLVMTLPPELVIERAVDARRDREGLAFGDVPAETVHEAGITLRLLRPMAHDRVAVIEGWIVGKGISPVQLPRLDIPTFAEPEFAASAQLITSPSAFVDAGERVFHEIRMRNDGDGPAPRLSIRVIPSNLAVYVPATTTINGMAIPDDGGASQLWTQRGLALADINPGVELRIRWEMSVMAPLPAGTLLETRAVLEWGDGQTLAIAAPELRIQAQPSLGETSIGTPISVARAFPADAPAYIPPPLPEPERAYAPAPAPYVAPPEPVEISPRAAEVTHGFVDDEMPAMDMSPIGPLAVDADAELEPEHMPLASEEPVASDTAENEDEGVAAEPEETEDIAGELVTPEMEVTAEQMPRAIADMIAAQVALEAPGVAPETEPAPPAPTLYIDFVPERLEHALKMLDRADAGGLVQHLFAMRMFFPEHVAGASPQLADALSTAARTQRSPLDRFFVRLRMPRLTVTSKDLEDRDSRHALRSMLDQLVAAGAAVAPDPAPGTVRLEGPLDVARLKSLVSELDASPLGAVAPWVVNAQMLGSTVVLGDTQSDSLAHYRGEMLKVLTVLSELPIDEFHRVLTASVNRSLDESLAGVLDTLRGAARLTVE
jgi:uncharacterized repeat protein (TIGR01451 family)